MAKSNSPEHVAWGYFHGFLSHSYLDRNILGLDLIVFFQTCDRISLKLQYVT